MRFLRIGEPVGDGFYSIAEFQAFCQAPSPFPPHLKVIDAPPAKVVEPAFWSFAWWENDTSSRVEMALALGGAGVARLGHLAGRRRARRN